MTGNRQKRSYLTEQRLIAAVIEVMGKAGLEGCTVPAVAKQAGVAVGTIYRRYPDKEALIAAAILDMVLLGDGEQQTDYVELASGARDLHHFLRRVCEAAVRIASGNRTLLLAIRSFSRATPDAAWLAQFEAHKGSGREAIVRSAMARFGPEIRGGEQSLRLALAALYGAVEAIWLEPQAGLFSEPPSPHEFVDAFAEMQMMFLSADGPSILIKPPRPESG